MSKKYEEPKSLWKSKAMWAGGLAMLGSGCAIVADYLSTGNIDMNKLYVFLTGLGIVGIRDKLEKVE